MPGPSARVVSAENARRLVVSRQRLAGPRPTGDAAGLMEVARDLNCLQIDPISVVARSHEIVLWSRLGSYDRAAFDRLVWAERMLFEYWAHAASLVLTEDYPIHRRLMLTYPSGRTARSREVRAWMEANRGLRRAILVRLRRAGPLPGRALQDASDVPWTSGGWTNERNVDQMLDLLMTQGVIMVAGRRGGQKLWDLAERCLPAWNPRERLGDVQTTRRASQLSLRSLGIATAKHIRDNFTAGRYPGLERVLETMRREGLIVPIAVEEEGARLPGEWFVHAEDIPLLDRIEGGGWEPRTSFLSPFDNMIRDRQRTEALFGFEYRMEIYVPKEKRRYGYYVLPILHGDRLIGRVDPRMDRERGRLIVNAVHAEPGAPPTPDAGRAVRGAIEELARFTGAREIETAGEAPAPWRTALR
jgi:uncharacterized protein